MTPQASGRPLDGVRVLDFGQYVAGPMAATLLADAGAEVTRIEQPGGPGIGRIDFLEHGHDRSFFGWLLKNPR